MVYKRKDYLKTVVNLLNGLIIMKLSKYNCKYNKTVWHEADKIVLLCLFVCFRVMPGFAWS